jgi:hypothetical protein
MKMLKILTPQLELLENLPQEALPDFLSARGLASRRNNRSDSIVVFDSNIESMLANTVDRKIAVIRKYRDNYQLLEDIRKNLSESDRVIFAPKMSSMRHFYSTRGFIHQMNTFREKIPNSEIIIPAGLYGTSHLFGLQHSESLKSNR